MLVCKQVLYFVSNLFFSCCGDYFAELISVQNNHQQGVEQPIDSPEKQQQLASAVPAWADMMSVVHGYVNLYKMRLFYVLQVR